MHFGRKRIPSMAKIVHRLAHVLGDGGAKDRVKYEFNTMLKRLTADPGMRWDRPDRRKRFAWSLFTDVYKDGSPKSRARNAIEHAFELGKWGRGDDAGYGHDAPTGAFSELPYTVTVQAASSIGSVLKVLESAAMPGT